ncbi:MAG: dual specificity protein phosphatase family protein [Chlamydiia bacterium]|nr:dual specificity protein phosphatase family protein [Chlamydiia bacterium]
MEKEALPGIYYGSKAHFNAVKHHCPYAEVISLVEVDLPPKPGFIHHFLPATGWDDLHALFEEAFRILDRASHKHPVLVHCKIGTVRCPAVIMAYMINRQNLTADEAFSKMEGISDDFLPSLREYEHETQ